MEDAYEVLEELTALTLCGHSDATLAFITHTLYHGLMLSRILAHPALEVRHVLAFLDEEAVPGTSCRNTSMTSVNNTNEGTLVYHACLTQPRND